MKYDSRIDFAERFQALVERFGLYDHALDPRDLTKFMRECRTFFVPDKVMAAADVLKEFFENLGESVDNWPPDLPMSIDAAIAAGRVIPNPSPSDRYKIKQWLINNQLLQYHPATKQTEFFTRITDQRERSEGQDNTEQNGVAH